MQAPAALSKHFGHLLVCPSKTGHWGTFLLQGPFYTRCWAWNLWRYSLAVVQKDCGCSVSRSRSLRRQWLAAASGPPLVWFCLARAWMESNMRVRLISRPRQRSRIQSHPILCSCSPYRWLTWTVLSTALWSLILFYSKSQSVLCVTVCGFLSGLKLRSCSYLKLWTFHFGFQVLTIELHFWEDSSLPSLSFCSLPIFLHC